MDLELTGPRTYDDVASAAFYRAILDPKKRKRAIADVSLADTIVRRLVLYLVLRHPPAEAFDLLASLFEGPMRGFGAEVLDLFTEHNLPSLKWGFRGPSPKDVARSMPAHFHGEPRWAQVVLAAWADGHWPRSGALSAFLLPHALVARPDEEVHAAFARYFRAGSPAWKKVGKSVPADASLLALDMIAAPKLTPKIERRLHDKLRTARLVPSLIEICTRKEARVAGSLVLRGVIETMPPDDPAAFAQLSPAFAAPMVASAKGREIAQLALDAFRGFRSPKLLALEPRWADLLAPLARTSLRYALPEVVKAPPAAKKKKR